MTSASASEALRVAGQEGLDLLNTICDDSRQRSNLCAPLSPAFIEAAHAVILTSSVKGGLGFGFSGGHGIALVKRRASTPRAVTEWSAPIFINLAYGEFGICLGFQRVLSFTLAMSDKLINQLLEGGHTVIGVDQSMVAFTPQVERRSDMIAVAAGEVDVASVSHANGFMVDFSLAGGKMSVDESKMHRVYGSGVTAAQVAAGALPPPAELGALYDRLSSLTQDARSRISPTRMTTSLERMTAGYDPERRIVTDAGETLETGGPPAELKPRPPPRVEPLADQSYGINVGLARRSADLHGTPTPVASVPRSAVAPAPTGPLA